ncbi:hypothetical protein SLEP1_g58732 [Rubroshorea leprosula]|uniref:Uncharacterized protein n=1 Tax=Rubroshorea leprosula TaxID=152421 RepID=A0AAV5MRF5_9ROSI|nr:hypothetical protein SLEP1_g58732 [Rubroshorea leprosula]
MRASPPSKMPIFEVLALMLGHPCCAAPPTPWPARFRGSRPTDALLSCQLPHCPIPPSEICLTKSPQTCYGRPPTNGLSVCKKSGQTEMVARNRLFEVMARFPAPWHGLWESNRVVALLVFTCAPNVWGSALLGVSVVLAGMGASGAAVRLALLQPSTRNGRVSGVYVVRVGRLLACATNYRPSRPLSPSRDVCFWVLYGSCVACQHRRHSVATLTLFLSVTPWGSQGGRKFGPVP